MIWATVSFWSASAPAGAAAGRRWSDFEEIPHVQGQRRSPSKTVGKITFRIKPHTLQRRPEGSNIPYVHQDPETSQRLRQNCVWVSPEEVLVSSGLLRGQGLWVQQTWVRHKPSWRRSPLTHHRARKTISLTIWNFVGKVMSLVFNMLSRLIIDFLPRSKQVSFNFMAAVTICYDFGVQENNSVTVSIVSPSICHELMGPDVMILVFWVLIEASFLIFSFTFIKRLFSSSLPSTITIAVSM